MTDVYMQRKTHYGGDTVSIKEYTEEQNAMHLMETHSSIDKFEINKPKTRTFPGADIGRDVDLVMMNTVLKLKMNRRNKTKKHTYT